MKLFERTVVVGFPSGSGNRNLKDEFSDVDEKYYVLPTFEDLYSRELFKKSEHTSEYDREVQDIRMLETQWFKANPTYIELLHAKEIKRFGHTTMNQILDMKDDIAAMNLSNFFSASMGIFNQQMRDMMKSTPDTKELVDEHGYNPKRGAGALHAVRTIVRFYETDFKDYGHANWYEGSDREFFLGIKRGSLKLEDFRFLAAQMAEEAEKLKDIYKRQPLDEKTNKNLQLLLRYLVQYRV